MISRHKRRTIIVGMIAGCTGWQALITPARTCVSQTRKDQTKSFRRQLGLEAPQNCGARQLAQSHLLGAHSRETQSHFDRQLEALERVCDFPEPIPRFQASRPRCNCRGPFGACPQALLAETAFQYPHSVTHVDADLVLDVFETTRVCPCRQR
jgi:hypothetical protein